jgi:signal transduction histidine kinase
MTWQHAITARPAAWTRSARGWARYLPSLARRTLRWLAQAEPPSPLAPSALALDLAIAAAATVAATVVVGRNPNCQQFGPVVQCMAQSSRHHLGELLVGAMTTMPLAVRRIRPLAGFWLIAATAVAAPHLADNVVSLAAVVVAAYSAVVYSRYQRAAVVSLPLVGLLVATAFPAVAESLRLPGRATALAAMIPVVFFGQAMRTWRRRAGESQARFDRLQAEHEAATALALATERARIASELHDVVTHNVSVMIVQAGAARHVLTDSPGAARDALLAVESSGRAAMAELRHLLGLLSPAADAGDTALGVEPDTEQLQPQPGLGQLRMLTDRVRAAGLEVQLRVAPLRPDLPPGLDLAAYRVIQEALTNVLKHVGPTKATVSVDCQRDRLGVCVTDAGPREPAPVPGTSVPGTSVPGTSVPGTAFRAHVTVPGTGRGLLGLRERVAVYGGELAAGPVPGGGWRVQASLPLDAVPARLDAQLLTLAAQYQGGAEPAGSRPAPAPCP